MMVAVIMLAIAAGVAAWVLAPLRAPKEARPQ